MSQKKQTKSSKPVKTKSNSSGPMNVELLEQLVKLMSTNDLNTVELRDGDKRVVLKRGAVVQTIAAAPVAHHAPVAAPAAPAGAKKAETPAADADAGLVAIKSPMVGTFYLKPSPDAKAFVNVGSVVNEETDVCIIEAMKVFNNIKAEVKGTIAKIVADDGKPVEFGQVLFLVKP